MAQKNNSLSLVYDWEYVSKSACTSSMGSEMLMTCIHTFCGVVTKAGYAPMIYFNQDLAKNLLDLSVLTEYSF